MANGSALFTSLVGVDRGKGRPVIEARVASTILMTGVLIGFLLSAGFLPARLWRLVHQNTFS